MTSLFHGFRPANLYIDADGSRNVIGMGPGLPTYQKAANAVKRLAADPQARAYGYLYTVVFCDDSGTTEVFADAAWRKSQMRRVAAS